MKRFRLACLSLIVMTFGPCVGLAAPDQSESDEQPVFFPPAPNPPRLQYLTKYSSAYDVSESNSKLRSFIFGGEENEEQILQKPYGVAVHEGAIYVVDTRGSGYVVFDVAQRKWRNVTGGGDGAMEKPINITIDEDGTRYVTDTQREVIIVFDNKDRFVRTIGEPGQFRPIDVLIKDNRLYVTDALHQVVHVLDKRSGESLFQFGRAGVGKGQLLHPTNLALAPDDTIYISDTTNFRIQQFSLEGEFIRELGTVGTGFGQFARPKGIDVDRDGRIYVVDAAFQNVQIFDDQGRILMFFGGAGNERGALNLPTAIKIDYDNVEYFRKYAAPGFEIEYLVLVINQFGEQKVSVFGFGSETG
jgi:DNA-binding beta-propeller fold protein YncE